MYQFKDSQVISKEKKLKQNSGKDTEKQSRNQQNWFNFDISSWWYFLFHRIKLLSLPNTKSSRCSVTKTQYLTNSTFSLFVIFLWASHYFKDDKNFG